LLSSDTSSVIIAITSLPLLSPVTNRIEQEGERSSVAMYYRG
jgi:hypothetical protein